MTRRASRPVVPRDGHTLVVGIVARISGCATQKDVSLEDQVDHAKQEIAALDYDGPVEYRVVSTRGKGERLDRPELAEIEAMLRSGELDFLVAEDIGRLVRGSDANRLCGLAVDHGTRVLAPNDCIDTAEASWEEDVISACRDHVGHNAHTSKRLKHKLMNRFVKQGGAVPLEVYGYDKPEGAKTYEDWVKDPGATAIYAEWFRRLLESPNCTAVADWLNRRGVPTGKYARRETWDGAMVRRLTANPILKGRPARGFKHTVKQHETGKRVSVKNPDGPRYIDCPHLAHVDEATWDEVNARLEEANGGMRRKPVDGADPRRRVPRKRTRFPGQHTTCDYCGRQVVWGGNGMPGNLQCNGSREWRCWNSIGFSGATAGARVVAAISGELSRVDGFEAQFREMVERATSEGDTDLARAREELARDERACELKKGNLVDAIAQFGVKPMLAEALEDVEATMRGLARRRRELDGRAGRRPSLPSSVADLRRAFEEKSRGLAADSPEFGDLLRLVVPEFRVRLTRLCDGGHLLPRATVRLDLGGLVPDVGYAPGLGGLLSRELTLDLFDPPQREAIREEVVRLTGEGLDQRAIADRLGVTQAAVSKAWTLDRRMRELGLTTPYVDVEQPPEDYSKLRRHRNPKYRFEPLGRGITAPT